MTTPTTDPGLFCPRESMTTDAMNSASDGKAKAVVCKLVSNWRKLIGSESNVHLFAQLIKKGVSTRDIHSFVAKQAKLKKVYRDLDISLSKAAMKGKLKDTLAFNVRQKRMVDKLKKDLYRATQSFQFCSFHNRNLSF